MSGFGTAARGKGNYLGTEIDGNWWKRYRRDGLFMRGNGEYWLGDRGFYFRRYLTKEPIFIPFDAMTGISLRKWHAGRWVCGRPILVIFWADGDIALGSGFTVGGRETTEKLKEKLASGIRG